MSKIRYHFNWKEKHGFSLMNARMPSPFEILKVNFLPQIFLPHYRIISYEI